MIKYKQIGFDDGQVREFSREEAEHNFSWKLLATIDQILESCRKDDANVVVVSKYPLHILIQTDSLEIIYSERSQIKFEINEESDKASSETTNGRWPLVKWPFLPSLNQIKYIMENIERYS